MAGVVRRGGLRIPDDEGMGLTLKNADYFEEVLDACFDDILEARRCHTLLMDLGRQFADYEREVALSNTFWSITVSALREATVIRLARVFDLNKKGVGLLPVLEAIRDNRHFFSTEEFQRRLSENPHMQMLSTVNRVPSDEQVEADIEFVESDARVVALRRRRDKLVAHKEAKIALGKSDFLAKYRLTYGDIGGLAEEAFDLLNRYLNLFKATTWSRMQVGDGDHEQIFRLMRIGLDAELADIERPLPEPEA